MQNPFDNPDGQFFVLTNDEGQHSLWPDFADIPLGWTVAFGVANRSSCINFIRQNWTDMRPQSLRALDFSLPTFIDKPTISGIAATIDSLASATTAPGAQLWEANDRTILSHAEQEMWLLEQLHPGSTGYLIHYVFRISGQLQLEAFQITITQLQRRHEVLRCTFQAEAGEPKRIIHSADDVTPTLTIVDLAAVGPADQETRIRELLLCDQRKPFDLATDYPIRWTLIRLTPEQHILALTVHHIAFDAWSEQVVGKDFQVLYDAAAGGVTPRLGALCPDYADYAVYQRESIRLGTKTDSIAYWERQLGGASSLDLPLDRPRPSIWCPDGDCVNIEIPAELASALAALGRRAGATRFMTMLAVFIGLLARISGQVDITVGTAVSGRDDEQTHKMVGLFANTVVIRAKLDAETTFLDLLANTVTSSLEAIEHQSVPFSLLVERLRPARDLSKNPLFRAMFVLEESSGSAFAAAGLHFDEIAVPSSMAKVDLTMALRHKSEGGFSGHLDYATALFDRSTVKRFAKLFLRLAERAVAEPNRRLNELPLSNVEQLDDMIH